MTRRWTAMAAVAVTLAFCAGCGAVRGGGKGSAGERLARGWDLYRLGEFNLAIKEFEAVAQGAESGSSNHLSALYAQATTWNLRRPAWDKARAERLYREVIALSPTNDLAAWSWLALARMRATPVGGGIPLLQPQVEAYQEVIDRFPFHPVGEEAFLHQQAARLEQPDEARTREVLAALETFLRTHPHSPWRSAAYGLVGHCCAVLGLKDRRLDAAFEAWRSAEIDPASPPSARDMSLFYWQVATLAEFETGDFAMAREYYRKFIAEYPREQRVFVAKQELKRMDELEDRIRSQGAGVRGQGAGVSGQESGGLLVPEFTQSSSVLVARYRPPADESGRRERPTREERPVQYLEKPEHRSEARLTPVSCLLPPEKRAP